jgi:hypothetical protein
MDPGLTHTVADLAADEAVTRGRRDRADDEVLPAAARTGQRQK